jgi:hypothetical protein
MNRRDFASLLLLSLGTAGCDLFQDKKQPLSGERIPVLGLGSRFEADPDLASAAVTLPAPAVNPDWPEPGAAGEAHARLVDQHRRRLRPLYPGAVAAAGRAGAGVRDGWRSAGQRTRCRTR